MSRIHCSVQTFSVFFLLFCCVVQGADLQPDFGVSATFSIVAVDPRTGECGAAVASKYPAVGKVVPFVRANVGAFCTQHWHNPKWGERALDLLAARLGPEEVLGILLADDPRRDKRQLAIIDMQGRAANRNPADADANGEYWGAMSGRFFACQGNTLAGRGVVVAMAQAYEDTAGSLADRLVAALLAADRAGGDHRGRLAAGIRIAKSGHDGHWLELDVDRSDNAVTELYRKYLSIEHKAKGEWSIQQAAFVDWIYPNSEAIPAGFAEAVDGVSLSSTRLAGASNWSDELVTRLLHRLSRGVRVNGNR